MRIRKSKLLYLALAVLVCGTFEAASVNARTSSSSIYVGQ